MRGLTNACRASFLTFLLFTKLFSASDKCNKEINRERWEFDEKSCMMNGSFPTNFLWGVATASYQIEGGAFVDGKGESIWDEFTHRKPSPIKDNSSGDDACKSYELYKRDVQMCVELGAKLYRFSLSWPRILTNGTPEKINQKGIQYYNNLIDELLKNEIQPMVTLYHFDLPQTLQEKGGWMSENITKWFVDYARVCFEQFGDRVKYWITFNEPIIFLDEGYSKGTLAPGLKDQNIYAAGHYLLKAHAKAYRLYDREFRRTQNGIVGISIGAFMFVPLTQTPEDLEATERALQLQIGWMTSPIFHSSGNYPTLMRDIVDRKSKEKGLPASLLPTFTEEEVKEITGTSDFFGLNHYTTRFVSNSKGEGMGDFHESIDESWPKSATVWLRPYPRGLRLLLNWIKTSYDNPPVYITENGFSDTTGTLQDSGRIEYYKTYLSEVLKAIDLDNCNVKGYTAWSLMDNFEWMNGYTERFGIYHVDFEDPNRKRTPKDSAQLIRQIFKENRVPS